MKNIKSVVLLSCGVFFSQPVFSGSMFVNGFDKFHFPQTRKDYCGAAIAQSWISYLKEFCPSQQELASFVGGISSYDLERILEAYTGRGFNVNGHSSEKSARERIYKELHDHRVLAIAGTTVRADGSTRIGGHWRIIWAGDVKSASNGYDLKWVQVIDPLYNSAWAKEYQTYSPYKQMTKNKLFSLHWKAFPNGSRQSVDD